MNAFTVREYAKDMEIPEGTAWGIINKGVAKGLFAKAHKVKLNGRLYQTYCFPDELAPKTFVMPKTTFWNDPFNKTKKLKRKST
jgi:hypothetical protein